MTILIAGFLLGGGAGYFLSDEIHDRFLASFNSDVLTPVHNPLNDTGDDDNNTLKSDFQYRTLVLPWTMTKASLRYDAWEKLCSWATDGADGDQIFSVNLLLGPSGSGKTRMSVEFARYLAQRATLGNPPSIRTPLTFFKYHNFRDQVSCRHGMPFLKSRETDPWDAGRIAVGGTREEDQIQKLRNWRPRRRTILILDDPMIADETGKYVTALSEASAHWKHSVRLLITSQSVPEDSGFSYDKGAWLYAKVETQHPPVQLGAKSWFSREDVHTLCSNRVVFPDPSVKTIFWGGSKPKDEFFDLTKGNPLLVTVGLEWVRNGGQLEGLTPFSLLEARAKRIYQSTRSFLRSTVEYEPFVISTLIGDALKRKDLKTALGDRLSLPDRQSMQRLFPASSFDLSKYVPAYAPPMISDAYTRFLKHERSELDEISMLRKAIEINPEKVFRRIDRPSPDDDPFVRGLLSLSEPGSNEIPPLDIVKLWMSRSMTWRGADVYGATLDPDDHSSHQIALRLIEVTPDDKLQDLRSFLLARVVNQADRNSQTTYRTPRLFSFFAELTPRASSSDNSVYSSYINDLMAVLEHHSFNGPVHADAIEKIALFLTEYAENHAPSIAIITAISEMFWKADYDYRASIAPIFESLEKEQDEDTPFSLTLRKIRTLAAHGASSAKVIEDKLAELPNHKNKDDLQNKIIALRHLAYAYSLIRNEEGSADTRKAATTVQDIADRFQDNADIQKEAAIAWRCFASAYGQIPNGEGSADTREAATTVQDIADRFQDNADIQKEAAIAWRSLAFAYGQIPNGEGSAEAREVATTVQGIADRFPDNAGIQVEAAIAWRALAYAYGLIRNGEGSADTRKAATTVQDIADRFPDNAGIQREAAAAWRALAYAYGLIRNGEGSAEAREAATTVQDIADRFPDNADIQEEAAVAWGCLAYAYCQIPNGEGSANVRDAATIVQEIANRFPDNAGIQKEAAIAWRALAYAYGLIRNGEGSADARKAATTVQDIADRFPDNADIQKEAAEAWGWLAYAYCQIPNGEGSADVREAATTVQDIANRFPDNADIQKQAAMAWRFLAYAYCQIPSGEGSAEAREAATTVQDIANRFPDNADIQKQAAVAWGCLAYAYSEIPNGEGSADTREAATTVQDIADRFPDNADIQKQAAEAWGCLAYAYCQIPNGEGSAEAREVATIVQDIADRFPDNANIQEAAAKAWVCLAYAYCQIPSGEGSAEAREAATTVQDIANRFPDNADIQKEAATAWSYIQSTD